MFTIAGTIFGAALGAFVAALNYDEKAYKINKKPLWIYGIFMASIFGLLFGSFGARADNNAEYDYEVTLETTNGPITINLPDDPRDIVGSDLTFHIEGDFATVKEVPQK